MAVPRLKFRRGTSAPSGSIALVAEPFFDTTAGNFYVATAADAFAKIGGPTYTTRVDNFLTGHTGSVSAILKLGDADNSFQVSISAPTTLAASYALTLPENDGDNGQVLTTNGSGGLSWVTAASTGFTTFAVDGTAVTSGTSNVVADQSSDTLTFAAGEGIDLFSDATNDLITITAELASTSNAGVASFSSDNFSVDANGVVTIKDDGVILGTETTGNYVASVATSATGGLTGGAAGSEGAAITLELKNNTNLSSNTVLKWDATNDQLVNSLITDDGSTVTIGGNLTVTGTTTSVNTTNTRVSDRLLELANGTIGTPTADSGLVIERGDLPNIFIGYDEGADVFVVGTTTIDGTGTDAAPSPIVFLAGAFNVSDSAGTNEAVVSYLAADGLFTGSTAGRYLQNITVDCGTY